MRATWWRVPGSTRDQCASCHGFHGKPSTFGAHMFPKAPPLWEKHHRNASIGVSDDPPGETYWKVANGIRLTGMPSFKGVLTENEMWQVSLLVASADKPLPPAAVEILHGEPPAPAPLLPQRKRSSHSNLGAPPSPRLCFYGFGVPNDRS